MEKRKCFFACLYRSPSQTDEFQEFYTDLNLFLSNIDDHNPACSVITGDFNARSPQWWALDKENNEGREISFLTSSAGYSQLIDQPTHITKESSSCIDLIFTSNPSFINASGIELSLYEKWHHNLIYGKINLNVPLLLPFSRENHLSVTESLHQDCGPYYLHLPIFSYTYTLLFCYKIKSCCDRSFLQ